MRRTRRRLPAPRPPRAGADASARRGGPIDPASAVATFIAEAQLPAQGSFIKLWAPSDYVLVVSESENFYRQLSKSYRFIPVDFPNLDGQIAQCRTQRPAPYADSRTYMGTVHEAMREAYGSYVLLDVGGYLGRFSIEFALMLGARSENGFAGRIYCFEPSPMKHILGLNLDINGCRDVSIVEAAVTDADGTVDFRCNNQALISSRVRKFPSATSSSLVKARRADSFLKERGLQGEAVVAKIDVEGAEDLVLRGFGAGIDNLACAIVEYWPETFARPFGPGQTLAEFTFRNYHVLYIRNSLYPLYPLRLTTSTAELDAFLANTTNIDILMVRKNGAGAERLVERLLALQPLAK
uniref:Methyltransferase FkbM domain-containing protein n=1 Tax=uncultured bacterium lac146 TaxID=1447238 RepID=X2L852_9BACT|nr:hypothetical protein [uncultured bacterium lac146]